MRVALISDIHANFEALKAVSPILETADRVICLGDFVGYYTQVNEVINYMRRVDACCILGNHDYFLLNGIKDETLSAAVKFGIHYARKVITRENHKWLASRPMTWGGQIGKRRWLLSHGSPYSPMKDYLYADNQKLKQLREFDYDIIAFGQTHRALIDDNVCPFLCNPGSVGQPRDLCCQASIMLVDTDAMEFQEIRQAFNPEITIKLAREAGAEDWIGKHLLQVP